MWTTLLVFVFLVGMMLRMIVVTIIIVMTEFGVLKNWGEWHLCEELPNHDDVDAWSVCRPVWLWNCDNQRHFEFNRDDQYDFCKIKLNNVVSRHIRNSRYTIRLNSCKSFLSIYNTYQIPYIIIHCRLIKSSTQQQSTNYVSLE